MKKIIPRFFIILLSLLFPLPTFAQDNTTSNFLAASDIHFNPFHTCNTEIPCPIIEELRQAPSKQWENIFAIYDTQAAEFGKDSNYPLFKSALEQLKIQAEAHHVQFVLITGDFFAHELKNNYEKYSTDKSEQGFESFAKKTLEFMNYELKQTFPTTTIYNVTGNNDAYADHYVSEPSGAFFHDAGEIWSQLINENENSNAMKNSFVKAGYYAIDLPQQKNIRLIVLNTNLFSAKASGAGVEQAAQEELEWLHEQLVSAHSKQQKIIIAEHIADQVDVYASLKMTPFKIIEMWRVDYSQRFQLETQQYVKDILGVFAGHLHSDWFQVLKSSSSNDNEITVTGIPSISPVSNNNPAFKIVEYNDQSLVDYTTYYYSLNETNTWNKEYSFNEVYQADCQQCKLSHGMNLLQATGERANFYKHFYAVGKDSQPITTANKWMPYYWCTIHAANIADYQQCLDGRNHI